MLGVARGYPRPIRELPALAPLLRRAAPTPGADLLAKLLRTLPTHSRLTSADLHRIELWLAETTTADPRNE